MIDLYETEYPGIYVTEDGYFVDDEGSIYDEDGDLIEEEAVIVEDAHRRKVQERKAAKMASKPTKRTAVEKGFTLQYHNGDPVSAEYVGREARYHHLGTKAKNAELKKNFIDDKNIAQIRARDHFNRPASNPPAVVSSSKGYASTIPGRSGFKGENPSGFTGKTIPNGGYSKFSNFKYNAGQALRNHKKAAIGVAGTAAALYAGKKVYNHFKKKKQ